MCEELRSAELAVMHRSWHREWAERRNEWRLSDDTISVDPRDYVWPVAPAVMSRVA
jgi:hypothetical protein